MGGAIILSHAHLPQPTQNEIRPSSFFCTENGSGAAALFNTMTELCAHSPLVTLEINEAELTSGAYADKISGFVQALPCEPIATTAKP